MGLDKCFQCGLNSAKEGFIDLVVQSDGELPNLIRSSSQPL